MWVSNIWEMSSSSQISKRRFTSSLHQLLILFLSCRCYTIMQKCDHHQAGGSDVRGGEESLARVCVFWPKMHRECKTAQRKYASRFGAKHLFHNKAKQSWCESSRRGLFCVHHINENSTLPFYFSIFRHSEGRLSGSLALKCSICLSAVCGFGGSTLKRLSCRPLKQMR